MLNFSIIVPIYNEEKSIVSLYLSLRGVMQRISQPYEIIFVNDGSTDNSLDVLKSIGLKPAHLIIVNLNKHAGQSIAMQAGFDIAQGELIITIDGDLQNHPEDIPKLLSKLNDGYDVVCGWRYHRKDPWNKKFVSKMASTILRLITKIKVHDFGCTLRIFKKEVLKNVYLSAGMHRFFVLIMYKLGYKVTEMKVQHHHRRFGKSKHQIHNILFECLMDFTRILLLDIHRLMEGRSHYGIRSIIRK